MGHNRGLAEGGTMDDSTAATSDRAAVVAAFDQARDAFLAAFAEVPDAALSYLPEGDEFALGGALAPRHAADS